MNMAKGQVAELGCSICSLDLVGQGCLETLLQVTLISFVDLLESRLQLGIEAWCLLFPMSLKQMRITYHFDKTRVHCSSNSACSIGEAAVVRPQHVIGYGGGNVGHFEGNFGREKLRKWVP
jgi:hypothetical protein